MKGDALVERIEHLAPCEEAVEWLRQQRSAPQAWRDCQRGDWMLWLIGRQVTSPPWSDDRKPLLACALDCAETAKKFWPEKQRQKIGDAMTVLRQWIKGKTMVEEAKGAKEQLWEAWRAADAAAAYAAAYAAADAAAAYAAAAAAAYAAAAYAAAAYAAYAAARAKALAECAAIVRKHFPKPPTIKSSAKRKAS